MASLGTFSIRIRVRADRVSDNVGRTVRKTALAVDQAVVLSTPVDTGRARSNWRVSLGSRPRGVINPYSPGSGLGRGEQQNAQAAMAQAAAAVAQRRDGQDIYISNNVPYIGKLNDGSSRQAPAGFVQQAVMAGVAAVKGARIVT